MGIELRYINDESWSKTDKVRGKECAHQYGCDQGESLPCNSSREHGGISPISRTLRAIAVPAHGRTPRRGGFASWNTCGGRPLREGARRRCRLAGRKPFRRSG